MNCQGAVGMHAWRAVDRKVRKGALCLCGASVIDRSVTVPTSKWVVGYTGWPALLEDA